MPMDYGDLLDQVIAKKGSEPAVLERLPTPDSPEILASRPDSFYLAAMTRAVFNAGFNWKVIDAKWSGFQSAFWDFDIHRCNFMSPDDLDELVSNTAIVRHGTKIKSVGANASMILDMADQYGSFAKMIADWPVTDQIGLMDLLKKKGARLGGNTGQYFLRAVGKDGFILSQDVTNALIREGILEKPATSKTQLRAVQDAFNQISDNGRHPHSHVSRLLAMTID